ncbi:MAG: YqgE/AlgH family protein [Gammaproteobacteria bacterium]|nr:YqgE/AlgH family protein [Gammaproteobacteria bacterium]
MSDFSLVNHFLVAMPGLADPNFHQTVTLICVHNEEGAMGLVINRPTDLRLQQVLEQMDLASSNTAVNNQTVYEGGPVQRDHGFILHRPDTQWNSTLNVSESLAVSTSRDVLEAISHGEGPAMTLVTLGYAGWGAGQLEEEINSNSWLTVPVNNAIIFDLPAESRWRAAVTELGIDPASLMSEAGHA